MTHNPQHTVRVRFAPSPTGYLHIGGARTALFNWLVARKAGGTFVLRIEDTDQARHVDDSVENILDDLRWLGLTWDEGPQAGGEYGPYFQSRRLDIYSQHLQRLLESGDAYYALETPEELRAMRGEAERQKRGFKYPRPDPLPTIEEGSAARARGRPVVVRFKMPGEAITVVDEILGKVTLEPDQLEDFVIQKSDGFPTYHFACVIDDALMNITHVLRGQEHLTNTSKHVALQLALGFATPRYAHLPVIFNMDGSKMSKRDKEKALKKGLAPPEIDVHDFRTAGYLPEAVVNFISLLGWSVGKDREQIDLKETVGLFSIARIGRTNARFDREKLLAFNTDWAARLAPERLLEAFKDFLAVNLPGGVPDRCEAGVGDGSDIEKRSATALRAVRDPQLGFPAPTLLTQQCHASPPTGADVPTAMGAADDTTLTKVLQACKGFRTFRDVINKAGFLFVPDEDVRYDPKAVKKVLDKNEGAGFAMLECLLPKVEAVTDWSAGPLEELIQGVVKEKATKLGNVAQPIRLAVTGTTVSPSIHDTLLLLGRERTLARLRQCLSQHNSNA